MSEHKDFIPWWVVGVPFTLTALTAVIGLIGLELGNETAKEIGYYGTAFFGGGLLVAGTAKYIAPH